MKGMRCLLLTSLITLFPIAVLAAGCRSSPPCEDINLGYPLTVTVTDEQAAIDSGVHVFCSINGAPELALPCRMAQNGEALECWFDRERAGTYTCRAVSSDGTRKAEGAVRVHEDECRVYPEHLELALP